MLLPADGRSWREIRAVAFVSFGLIRNCLDRWRKSGAAGVVGDAEKPAKKILRLGRVINWLPRKTPQDFGFCRSRWSCATLAETLAWETDDRPSAETVRRVLRSIGWVRRRPRPVVGPIDPNDKPKLRRIRRLLTCLRHDETAVFEDEVDVHLNPKIGSCRMPRGKQAEVVTPGNNEKRHVAGSPYWRTGRLLASRPQRCRNTKLFLSHLDDVRRRLRGFRRIHVVCDNAAFPRSRDVFEYLTPWGVG